MTPFWLGLLALIVIGLGFGALLARRLHRDAERLGQEQALLRAVIEGTSDAIFLKDTSGRYRLANSAFARVLNRPVGEILGRDDDELFPPETAREYREADQQVMAAGEPCLVESVTEAACRASSAAPGTSPSGRRSRRRSARPETSWRWGSASGRRPSTARTRS
jgi:PAS domain S-box-containing protein